MERYIDVFYQLPNEAPHAEAVCKRKRKEKEVKNGRRARNVELFVTKDYVEKKANRKRKREIFFFLVRTIQ